MMFENIINYFKKISKKNKNSKEKAKERLQLVLTQDRANVSVDYLDLMKQEIIEVIKKYINIDEAALEVELTKPTEGVPSLIANIPILSVKPSDIIEKKENFDEKENKDDPDNNVSGNNLNNNINDNADITIVTITNNNENNNNEDKNAENKVDDNNN